MTPDRPRANSAYCTHSKPPLVWLHEATTLGVINVATAKAGPKRRLRRELCERASAPDGVASLPRMSNDSVSTDPVVYRALCANSHLRGAENVRNPCRRPRWLDAKYPRASAKAQVAIPGGPGRLGLSPSGAHAARYILFTCVLRFPTPTLLTPGANPIPRSTTQGRQLCRILPD